MRIASRALTSVSATPDSISTMLPLSSKRGSPSMSATMGLISRIFMVKGPRTGLTVRGPRHPTQAILRYLNASYWDAALVFLAKAK